MVYDPQLAHIQSDIERKSKMTPSRGAAQLIADANKRIRACPFFKKYRRHKWVKSFEFHWCGVCPKRGKRVKYDH